MFPKLFSRLVIFSAVLLPLVAFAAAPADFKGLITLILTDIFTPLIALIIGLAFVTFLWGIYKYVSTASNEGKAGAKETIIYGLVGLFVMLSVWGLVKILTETFGVGNVIPQLQTRP